MSLSVSLVARRRPLPEVTVMANDTPVPTTVASLVLRVALGAIFLYHGVTKVFEKGNDWGLQWASQLWLKQGSLPPSVGANLDKLAQSEKFTKEEQTTIREIKEQLGPVYAGEAGPMPQTLRYHGLQLAVAWGELLGGAALLLGALTRLSALAMIVIQLGAMWTVTLSKGFSFAGGGGYEYNLALLGMCLAVAILGAGSLSVDHCCMGGRKRQAVVAEPVKV
jgi:putative oxidoreductase